MRAGGTAVIEVSGELLPATLSSDELRAAARLAGRAALPAFATGWDPQEAAVADAVALRGLLARGLAGIVDPNGCPAVELTGPAWSALGPLLAPDTLVEVTVDASTGRRRHLVGGLAGRTLLATERHPAIWQISPDARAPEAVALVVVDLPAGAAAESAVRMVVDPRTLAEAEVSQSRDSTGLPALLHGRGLSTEVARELAGVLPAVRATVTVRLVRQVDATTSAAGVVSWLDAGATGSWLVQPAESADDDADADDDAPGPLLLELVPASPAVVRDAVVGLLSPQEALCVR